MRKVLFDKIYSYTSYLLQHRSLMVLVIHTFIIFSYKCKIPISIDNLSFTSIILRTNTGEIDRKLIKLTGSNFFLKFCKISLLLLLLISLLLKYYSTSIFSYNYWYSSKLFILNLFHIFCACPQSLSVISKLFSSLKIDSPERSNFLLNLFHELKWS